MLHFMMKCTVWHGTVSNDVRSVQLHLIPHILHTHVLCTAVSTYFILSPASSTSFTADPNPKKEYPEGARTESAPCTVRVKNVIFL